MEESPIVFISHRHRDDDSKIAEIIKNNLLNWGVDKNSIFLSSDPKRNVETGKDLMESLKLELQKTNLFILVYTNHGPGWDVPMVELGIATGNDTVPSKIVVFQCTKDVPHASQGRRNVKLELKKELHEIISFTEDFHKRKGFIPSKDENPKALMPSISDDAINNRAQTFYEELIPILRKPKVHRDRHLWDFIRLKLDSQRIDELIELNQRIGFEKSRQEAFQILKGNLILQKPKFEGVGNDANTAVQHFGFAAYDDNLTLENLINQWNQGDKTEQALWSNGLCQTIYCAIVNKPPPALSNPFYSTSKGMDCWFLAAVTRLRTNTDDSREFDVYLIRRKSNTDTTNIKPNNTTENIWMEF